MYYKKFEHTQERFLLFHNGKAYPKSQEISIQTQFYKDKRPFVSLKVLKNTGRVPPAEIAARLNEFTEDAKIGDKFGKSWDTNWFLVEFEIPDEWLGEDQEVHWVWNGKCEASIFPIDGSKLLAAFTENVREKYIIKRPGVKNDLTDPVVNKTGSKNRIQYLLEEACNEMFGNFKEGFLSQVDMEKEFTLEKCEIGLFNRHAWNLFFNFEVLKDGAKEFEKEQSSRAYDCLMFANQIMNECPTPFKEPGVIERAEEKTKLWINGRRNGNTQHQVYAIGHCHIDTAWLWPYAETKRKIARSWSSQLEMMRHYPDYKFCASQVSQYHWLKLNYPEVFERVKEAQKEGKFELVGGSWVECDGNVPSGESMIRQLLHGQRFLKENFGTTVEVFFLPDTFGYSPNFPQIVKSAGIKYFLTQKLSWSQINKFPHSTFFWRGIDGSEVLTHFPPADTYNSSGELQHVIMSHTNFKDKGRSNSSLLLYGDGDGGGGPQFEHIERISRLTDFDGLPKVKLGTVHEFFQQLEDSSKNMFGEPNPLFKWEGELYLELHNGTYTTQARTKKYCRVIENQLRDCELLTTFCHFLTGGEHQFDVQAFKDMWQTFLIDQFHDVLPGTSIGMVYKDVEKNWQELEAKTRELYEKAICSVVEKKLGLSFQSSTQTRFNHWVFSNENQIIILYNPSSMARTEILDTGVSGIYKLDIQGHQFKILRLEDLTKEHPEKIQYTKINDKLFEVENKFYKLQIDGNGRITSYLDKRTKNKPRQIVKPGQALNTLTIHNDVPFFWDAWDTFLYDFETKFEIDAYDCSDVGINDHVVSQVWKYKYGESDISISISFYVDTPRIDFDFQCDWRESRKFMKVYFPLELRTDYATFDCQNGTLRRPTHANTSWDQAKFEVFGHKFCDVSESNYGVAIINDCKYGWSARDNSIGLSLLKAPKFPDHECDMGSHRVSYSMLAHDTPLSQSTVYQEAHMLNEKLYSFKLTKPSDEEEVKKLYAMFDGQQLISVDSPNIIVDTFKRGEDDQFWILRVHEERGDETTVKIQFNQNFIKFKSVKQVNSLEVEDEDYLKENNTNFVFNEQTGELIADLKAFKIATFALYN